MYAKVFGKILDSSIAEDWYLRHVFMDLLVLADRDGIVDMTLEAIARRTNAPDIPMLKRAISGLESPDTASRTEEDDGRRIERIDEHRDWGWKIINFERYRKLKTTEELREKNREKVRRYRERKRGVTGNVPPSTPHVTKDAYASAYASEGSTEGGSSKPDSDSLVQLWNRHRGVLLECKRLSAKRRRAVISRLSETPDLSRWEAGIKRAASSKFCSGGGDRKWVADFDWLIRPDTLTHIEEGRYDDKKAGPRKLFSGEAPE